MSIEYKLKSHREFSDMLHSVPGFAEYADGVYQYLSRMVPGQIFDLSPYTPKHREWIIKTACVFIDEGEHWREYSISDDYTAVIRERYPASKSQPRTSHANPRSRTPVTS